MLPEDSGESKVFPLKNNFVPFLALFFSFLGTAIALGTAVQTGLFGMLSMPFAFFALAMQQTMSVERKGKDVHVKVGGSIKVLPINDIASIFVGFRSSLGCNFRYCNSAGAAMGKKEGVIFITLKTKPGCCATTEYFLSLDSQREDFLKTVLTPAALERLAGLAKV